MGGLDGRRVLVVGASSGIGRAFAARCVSMGADVVFAARRAELLADAVDAAGGGRWLAGDITVAHECAQLVGAAAGALGGFDVVLVAAGTGSLRWLADATAGDWESTLRTNLVAVNDVVRHALAHLAEGAIVLALSSDSVSQPRAALAIYRASKAALEASFESWRVEHPGVRFGCVTIGPKFPTGFGEGFDAAALDAAMAHWLSRGIVQEGLMSTDDVAAVIAGTVAAAIDRPGIAVEHLTVRSPSPIVTTRPPRPE